MISIDEIDAPQLGEGVRIAREMVMRIPQRTGYLKEGNEYDRQGKGRCQEG